MPINLKNLVARSLQFVLPLLLAAAFLVLLAKQGTSAAKPSGGYPGLVATQAPEGDPGSGYPGPVATQAPAGYPGTSTPDANAICSQGLILRGLPTDSPKRIVEDRDYNDCMSARETPRPAVVVTKPIDVAPTLTMTVDDTPRRIAGEGEIIDDGLAPLPGMAYVVLNSWRRETSDKVIQVYAGAVRDTPDGPPGAVQGMVTVAVSTLDYQALPKEGGFYLTPAKVGPVRIVDAVNQVLTLVAGDGSLFTFDVVSRQWIQSSATGVFQRKAGDGTIVESPTTPYATQDDKIGNQWNEIVGEQLVTVLAGGEVSDTEHGAIVVIVADAKNPDTVVSRQVYVAPTQGGMLHIFDATGQRLVLGSANGNKLIFDVAARQFVIP